MAVVAVMAVIVCDVVDVEVATMVVAMGAAGGSCTALLPITSTRARTTTTATAAALTPSHSTPYPPAHLWRVVKHEALVAHAAQLGCVTFRRRALRSAITFVRFLLKPEHEEALRLALRLNLGHLGAVGVSVAAIGTGPCARHCCRGTRREVLG